MPTYQYKCRQCGFELEEFQSMTEPPLVHCPQCNTDNLARALGTGGGLIFKGSGFYLTDYKKDRGGGASSSSRTDDKKDDKKSEAKESKPSTPSGGESSSSGSTPPKDPK